MYGLRPGHIRSPDCPMRMPSSAGLLCTSCGAQQVVHPDRVAGLDRAPLPRYRCDGAARSRGRRPPRPRTTTAVSTSTEACSGSSPANTPACSPGASANSSSRASARAGRYTDPNVLSCTPTLEMGIDIGDLSAVLLASLPPATRQLCAAGRPGRTLQRERAHRHPHRRAASGNGTSSPNHAT